MVPFKKDSLVAADRLGLRENRCVWFLTP